MKKALTAMSISGLALTGMFGLSLALPGSDASAASWSPVYNTESQCNTARNAKLGMGHRGSMPGSCQPIGSSSASSGYIIGYAFKF